MGLVHKTIPGLFNGVSQQPAPLRLESQGSLQENALSDMVDGLVKRPNTEHIAQLSSNADNNTFMHTINRDVSERYVVIITDDPNEPIEIFTLDGTKCTVNYDAGTKSYVTVANPKEDLRAVTVADHTILVNRTVEAKMASPNVLLPNPMALGYIKRGFPEITYTIKVYNASGSQIASASYTTPAPTSQGVTTTKTDVIANQLASSLSSSLGSGWYIDNLGSVVVLENANGDDFSIECNDSYGDTATVAVNGAIQKFEDLPPTAPDGYRVRIEGDEDSNFDNYYVKYKMKENIWEETHALVDEDGNVIPHEMDAATLPHRLIRSDYNTFTLKTIQWERREIGDLNSAPEPSFIGRTIKDVFFFKNRLGFLAGENVIFSRASEYFNLFPSTATSVIDSDPIDNAVSSRRVANLEHAVPFASNLLLFSDQQQFTVGAADNLLTPTTIAIDPSTYFEASIKCKPVGVSANLYFVVPKGQYSSVREYYVQTNAITNDADEITAHVPRYLPDNITKLTSSNAEDIIFALSPDEPHNVYVYRYYWEGDEKVQSSWSKWVFDDVVLDIEVLDNYLYMVTKKDGQVHLVRLNLDPTVATEGLDFRVHLDKQVRLTGTYDEVTEKTTWTLPYIDSSDNFVVVNGNNGNRINNVEKVSNTTLEVSGDFSGIPCIVGKAFKERYKFSKFYLKDNNGIANVQGTLKIRSITLSYTDTGVFDVIVDSEGREPKRQTFTGVILGVSKIGEPSMVSGEKTFSVQGAADNTEITIESDSYLPVKIQIAAYEAEWSTRAQQY